MSNIVTSPQSTIIGAGWLGFPLAHHLLHAGHNVVATKQLVTPELQAQYALAITSPLKESFQLIPFSDALLKDHALSVESLTTLFRDRQVIITIPPTPFIQRYPPMQAAQGIADYAQFIQEIMQLATTYGAQEIIYTSSTSVYGNSSGIIHEGLPAMPQTNNAKAIRKAEKMLEECPLPVTILRLAGLIGHGRHPILTLQGRENIRSPMNAINLLHITDLINAITTILARTKAPHHYDIYNLVAPFHPNRQSYYQTLAQQLSLPLPLFETAKPELKRIMDGGKITEQGDFHYRVVDLYQATIEA